VGIYAAEAEESDGGVGEGEQTQQRPLGSAVLGLCSD
jgi:hypothetical protein